jgi:YHS domain-containing protein
LNIRVRDFLHPSRPAVLDSTRRTWIGLDAFFFADRASMDQFRRMPLRYVKKLSDPVTLERFHPTPKSPQTTFKGRPYYFASQETWKTFQAYPDSFSQRHGM